MIGRFGSQPALCILFWFAVVLMLFFGEACEATVAPRPFRIYMITWRGVTDVEQGFQNYMAEKNIPVEYIMRDANKDQAKLADFVNEIRRLKPDLVYTWGTPVTLGIVGRYDAPNTSDFIRDIPVVFALVADPVGVKMVHSLLSPKRNITGVYHIAGVDSVIAGITSFRAFKKIGILYNKTEPNMVSYVKDLRSLSAAKGFQLLERTFKLGADGKPVADGVANVLHDLKNNGAEWLLIGPDSYLTSIPEIIGPALREVKLPVFATTEAVIKFPEGVLAGLVCKYYSIGQFAGFKAEQILVKKEKVSDIPIQTLRRFSYIVHIDVAKELLFYPPVSMFNYAEIL